MLNAAQYTPSGTKITIKTDFKAGNIFLIVEDEGPGIPEDSLKKIFEKFYRAPGSRAGGTGLGLSITHGFVTAHGGSVEVRNRPEGGARFIIRLPVESKPFTLSEAQ